jgi:dipeptidyl aminopeptidase/acylaminoacyl peptidase
MICQYVRWWRVVSVLALVVCLAGCNVPGHIGGSAPSRRTDMTGIEVVRFPSGDGVQLEGWWWQAEPYNAEYHDEPRELVERRAATTVIFCHGATDTANSPISAFLANSGYRLFTFDYRSHGRSQKAPLTNSGMTKDAIAAWEHVRCTPGVDPSRIIVVGHSMGASYALAIAAHANAVGAPVRAVVSSSGFSSWKMAASGAYPIIGFLFGTADGEEAHEWAGRLGATPLLIAHTKKDDVVSVNNAPRLERAARRSGTPVEMLIWPQGGHAGTYFFDDEFTNAILAFMDKHAGIPHETRP